VMNIRDDDPRIELPPHRSPSPCHFWNARPAAETPGLVPSQFLCVLRQLKTDEVVLITKCSKISSNTENTAQVLFRQIGQILDPWQAQVTGSDLLNDLKHHQASDYSPEFEIDVWRQGSTTEQPLWVHDGNGTDFAKISRSDAINMIADVLARMQQPRQPLTTGVHVTEAPDLVVWLRHKFSDWGSDHIARIVSKKYDSIYSLPSSLPPTARTLQMFETPISKRDGARHAFQNLANVLHVTPVSRKRVIGTISGLEDVQSDLCRAEMGYLPKKRHLGERYA